MRDLKRISAPKQIVSSIEEALIIVRQFYPEATKEGSVGSWSFVVGEKIVAEMWIHRNKPVWWLRILKRNVMRKGFTLTEMLVVMGIMVLMATLSIPLVRYLMGSTSISMARNNLSSFLARAREEAVAQQDVRGVMFYVNPSTNRVIGVQVMRAAIQDPNINVLLLDMIPNRDAMSLPSGVRMQMVFNGLNPLNTANGAGDHYLGFNPSPVPTLVSAGMGVALPPMLGGVILFDGNGKLIVRPYGFQLSRPNGGAIPVASTLCVNLGLDYSKAPVYTAAPNAGCAQNITLGSYAIIPGYVQNPSAKVQPPSMLLSQVGIILFDYDTFKSMGFTDQDADFQPSQGYGAPWPVNATYDGDGVHTEGEEELWLDSNSTPLMINRYDGTLIRAE